MVHSWFVHASFNPRSFVLFQNVQSIYSTSKPLFYQAHASLWFVIYLKMMTLVRYFSSLFLLISKHMGKLNSIFHVFVVFFGYYAPTWIYSGYTFYLMTHLIFAFKWKVGYHVPKYVCYNKFITILITNSFTLSWSILKNSNLLS